MRKGDEEMDALDVFLEYATYGLLILAAAGFSFLILTSEGCATRPREYTRGPLANQILRPLPGHTGLVNSECKRDPKTWECIWNVVEYDLHDQPTRQRLRDAGFICELVDPRGAYRIAEKQPALIFETYDQTCFLGFCGKKNERVLDLILIDDYQSLIDRKTECYSAFTYNYYKGQSE